MQDDSQSEQKKVTIPICDIFSFSTLLSADCLAALFLLSEGERKFFLLLVFRTLLSLACVSFCASCNARVVDPNPRQGLAISADPLLQSSDSLDKAERRKQLRDDALAKRSFRATVSVGACFLGVSSATIYTGLWVGSAADTSVFDAIALTTIVLCMNCEFYYIKAFIASFTEEEGEDLPSVHEHTLYYVAKVTMATCTLCRKKIGPKTGSYEAYSCKECDQGKKGLSICLPCYRLAKGSTGGQDNFLRSDSGPKPPFEFTTVQYVQRAMKLMLPFALNFGGALLCIACNQILQLIAPTYQGRLVDLLVHQDSGTFYYTLKVWVAIKCSTALFSSLQSLFVSIVSKRITLNIRVEMFKSLVRQDIVFYDMTMTGQLTNRMTADAGAVTTPVNQIMNNLIPQNFKLVGGAIMCIYTSWKLTMVAFSMVFPVIYVTQTYAKWSKDLNLSVRAAMADASASATEALKNMKTVRTFCGFTFEVQKFQEYMDIAWSMMRKDVVASSALSAITFYLDYAGTILVFVYGGGMVLSKSSNEHIDVGQLITFNLYWSMLSSSILGLNSMASTLIVAASAAKRVFEVIDLEPDIAIDDPLGRCLPRGKAIAIEFQNVEFFYQTRPAKNLFSDLSFAIPAGTSAAFVGKSGMGKSTSLGLILRFYDPREGAVLIDGHPLPEYNLKQFYRRIGLVSQETQTFAMSVRDNLTYGMEVGEFNESSIMWACQQANAHDFILEMERGYDTLLGEGGSGLSGGQKQRLSIARAFLHRPQLLLLDEATSALDSVNEKQIQTALDEMVNSMHGNCTVVMIAHRLSTVMGCDQIIVVHEGRVHECGSHGALMANDKIYAELVRQQAALAEHIPPEPTPAVEFLPLTQSGSGSPCQKRWQSKVADLESEDRKLFVRARFKKMLSRAAKAIGQDEVVDAVVSELQEAVDSHPIVEDAIESIATEDFARPRADSDSIDHLFSKIGSKLSMASLRTVDFSIHESKQESP